LENAPISNPQNVNARLAPNAYLNIGVLVVLKLYFDKSGQEDAAYLALGGVAANDSLWGEIEGDWRSYLSNHNPPAAYMHLVEAVPLRGEFRREKGWDDDKVFGLVNSLLSYLTTLPKHQYCHSTSGQTEWKGGMFTDGTASVAIGCANGR
jgi:hypothetical protein